MRRLDVTGGNLSLMDYCTAGPQYASGGFIADSRAAVRHQRLAAAVADPQQRGRRLVQRRLEPGLLRRRGRARRRGVPEPAVHDARRRPRSAARSRTCSSTTTGATTCACPPRRPTPAASPGPTAMTPGRTHPDHRLLRREARRLGAGRSTTQLARGKHLLLTPGRLRRRAARIEVKRADTVVLGLGHATLTAVDGAVPLEVADVPRHRRRRRHDRRRHGRVAGAAAGRASPATGTATKLDPANPTTLTDVYFRVGGPHVGKADDRARGQQRQRAHRPHLGVARRPRRRGLHRRHRALEHQHRPQRRRRQRRRRHRDRPVRRALPAVQHGLERRARHARSSTRTSCRTTRRPRRTGRTTARWAGPATRSPTTCTTHTLVRRRRLRLQPEQPVDPHRERLRGARRRRASSCTTS